MNLIRFRLSTGILLLYCISAYGQTGHVVHGVGAINQSMAGAGTAIPLDATGVIFWNPGSITDLQRSELDIILDLGLIDAALSSSLTPSAFAPTIPPRALSGSSRSEVERAVLGSELRKRHTRPDFQS